MWNERLKRIINESSMKKIKNACVLVIGLGGVGGMALETIVRSGVENIIIVDNDIVDITNLNRQIISLNDNIGKQKTSVAKERILNINSNCNVIVINEFIDDTNINELFKYKLDYIIDACDTINTKALIIAECLKRNIKFISCMGTANKFNPELLKIVELKNTSYDPIAKILRNKFKTEKRKILTVSSTEQIKHSSLLGTTSMVPMSAGILCASYVINDILKGE